MYFLETPTLALGRRPHFPEHQNVNLVLLQVLLTACQDTPRKKEDRSSRPSQEFIQRP